MCSLFHFRWRSLKSTNSKLSAPCWTSIPSFSNSLNFTRPAPIAASTNLGWRKPLPDLVSCCDARTASLSSTAALCAFELTTVIIKITTVMNRRQSSWCSVFNYYRTSFFSSFLLLIFMLSYTEFCFNDCSRRVVCYAVHGVNLLKMRFQLIF